MTSPREVVAALPAFGVSGAVGAGVARHVVHRKKEKTLCGKEPVTLFGVDLTTRRQVSCLRCYKLAFTSVNACASSTPDTVLDKDWS